MSSHYMTVKELFDNALELARKDPTFAEAETKCQLDYHLICSGVTYDPLKRCEFDVIGYPNFGNSEGIYGDIFLYGQWVENQHDDPFRSRMRVYSLKTLREDKEGFMAMSTLVNLLCFYARSYVNENLNRFD